MAEGSRREEVMSHSRKFHSAPHSNPRSYLTAPLPRCHLETSRIKLCPEPVPCSVPAPVLVNCAKQIFVTPTIFCVWEGEPVTLPPFRWRGRGCVRVGMTLVSRSGTEAR